MTAINRRLIFDAAKRRGAVFRTMADVRDMDAAIDAAFAPESPPDSISAPLAPVGTPTATHRKLSPRGRELIHSFEQCKLEAYPDPGSKDGKPVTIGWGSTSGLTGEPIRLGTVWTQELADAKFEQDIAKFEQAVDKATAGTLTDQSMFDALVSLTYNIGVGAFQKSTVLRKHKAGDHAGAAAAFGMWVRNDGKILRGLVRRRAAEAALYLADD